MSKDEPTTRRSGSERDPRGSEPLSLIILGPQSASVHPLPAVGEVAIGRGAHANISVEDPLVSRRHAVLYVGRRLRLRDLGSANGTRVRDTTMPPGATVDLSPGDIVEVGGTMLIVRGKPPGAPSDSSPNGAAAQAASSETPMHRLQRLVERVAPGHITVLLLGETGAGKEVIADRIHRLSRRSAGPFRVLHCAALSESLLESELFGHEKGAFTGAERAKPGLIESADGGTLFIDEVGELPPATQVKLLRVLEQREVTRVGALQPRPIDVRFVAATNRDLAAEVAQGAFRQDLYFRLDGITLVVPPLRERRDEIEPLARGFIAEACRRGGEPVPEITAAALALLLRHDWPGNVRELRNVVERAVLLAGGGPIEAEHIVLPRVAYTPATPAAAMKVEPAPAPAAPLRRDLEEIERRRIVEALEQCAGNQTQAAALLGMPRRTLVSRIEAYGLRRPRKGTHR